MRPKIIPRSVVANEIGAALDQLASDLDAKLAQPLESAAAEQCFSRLRKLVSRSEVMVLFRLIAEQRIECADCGDGVGYSHASGAWCLPCAQRRRDAGVIHS